MPATAFMIIFAVIFVHLFSFSSCKSILISWSTPAGITKPATGKETLLAIQTHLQALHLANVVPRALGIENDWQIKLCPPQPFDPLVNEFSVPRMSGYSLLYDHDCILRGHEGFEVKWGSKPNVPIPDSPSFYGKEGLSVPNFVYELYKQNANKSEFNNKQIWLIDSDSLRSWFTALTLNYVAKPGKSMIPPAVLMRQINSMYGSIGEKDLKNMPQAIQGALLIVLPDYSTWRQDFHPKSLFNPTWWISRSVPREKDEIVAVMKKIIKRLRRSDQLIIVHHDPTKFNFEIISSLAPIYGETSLISSTTFLPKSFTTFELLQFIQKASVLVVDSRDLLGQMGLLATGFNDRVALIQNNLPYTDMELGLKSILLVWFLSVLFVRIFYTQKHYNVPLHVHMLRFALFTILAVTPVIVLTPSMWPKYASMLIYSIFEAGYEAIIYGIIAFYSVAGFITIIVVIVDKRNARINNEEVSDDLENDSISDNESIQLVTK